jgi:hypothetical protein
VAAVAVVERVVVAGVVITGIQPPVGSWDGSSKAGASTEEERQLLLHGCGSITRARKVARSWVERRTSSWAVNEGLENGQNSAAGLEEETLLD